MSTSGNTYRLVSATPGRVRLHLIEWSGGDRRQLECRLSALPGVRGVSASTLTRNVLLHFDPAITSAGRLAASAASIVRRRMGAGDPTTTLHACRRIHAVLERLSDVIGNVHAVPLLRLALHALLGRRVTTLLFLLAAAAGVIVAFLSVNHPRDVVTAGIRSVGLYKEVIALRAA